MMKDNTCFTFVEHKNRKNPCFLNTSVSNCNLIASIDTDKPKTEILDRVDGLQPWDFNNFHNKFGHHGEQWLQSIAKTLGYDLKGPVSKCDTCALIKSYAKPIPRTSQLNTSFVGERMGLDISGPFPLTSGKNHTPIKQKLFWYGLIDFYSGKMIHSFRYNKNELVSFVEEAYTFMKSRKTPIKILCMYNGGENLPVVAKCKNEWNILV